MMTRQPSPPALNGSRLGTMSPRRTRYVIRNQTVLRNRKNSFHICTESFSSGLTERCDAAFLINSCPPFLTLPAKSSDPATAESVRLAAFSARKDRSTPSVRLSQPNLPHQPDEVVEEPFLRDLALLVPRGHGAELDVEALVGRRDRLAVRDLHGPLHRPVEVGHGTGLVAVREQDLVGPVDQVVVGERLEEFFGLGLMVGSPSGRVRLSRPVHGRVRGVALPEYGPVLLVPCVVQRLHQLENLFALHAPPRSPRIPSPRKYLCPSSGASSSSLIHRAHG